MLCSLTILILWTLQAQGVELFIGFVVSDRRCGIKVDNLVAVLRAPFLGSLERCVRPFADRFAEDFVR